MKFKLALIALTVGIITVVPLAASEIMWEVLVPTGLQPSLLSLPDPLPEPSPIPLEILAAEPVAAASPQPGIPPRVPTFGPTLKPGKALFNANLLLMVGLNVADYVSTREALKYPGLSETNPLMKPFVKNPAAFAAIKFGTTALTYLSMKAIFKRSKTAAWVMTTASNIVLSYVVANNVRLIQGAQAR